MMKIENSDIVKSRHRVTLVIKATKIAT